jgi:Flp pilus assembly protein TadB
VPIALAPLSTSVATWRADDDHVRVGLRERLAELDDRARVQDETPARWFVVLVVGALVAVVVVAAALGRTDVLLFVPVVLGIWVARRWSRRDR